MIYDPEISRIFLKAVGVFPDDYFITEGGIRWQPGSGLAAWKNDQCGSGWARKAHVNPRTGLLRVKAAEKEARRQAAFFGCGVAASPAW
jgi:hypothetical protein